MAESAAGGGGAAGAGDAARQQIEFIEASDGEYLRLEESEGPEGEGPDAEEGEEHWEQNGIRQLLQLYLQNVDKFRNPKVRKKNVWTEIGTLVGKTPDGCDKKFRNLKQTYIRLLKKKKRTGAAAIKWPYFDTFEEIYFNNGQYYPEIDLKMKKEPSDTASSKPHYASVRASKYDHADLHENGSEHSERASLMEVRKKLTRKRHAEFRRVTEEMRERQHSVEVKLDRLISIVEDSNSIQRERNRLFQQYLERLHQNV